MTVFLGTRKLRTLLLSGAAATLAAQGAHAQEGAAKATDLGTITLLGTGLETTVFENPSAVSVVDEEEISRIPPARVADYLKDIPGVRVEEQGITRIRIRGEEARRVRILVNGQAITDHTTYGPPVVVDPATVERIEVVRGASSVISGQRAIGGTINIITKRGTDKPFEASTTLSYFGATEGWRVSNSIAGRQGGFTWRLSQGKSDLGNRHAAGVGELVPSGVEDQNWSGYMGYETGNHSFGVEAQAFDLSSDVYTGDPNFSIDLPKRDLRKIGVFYEGTNLTPWMTSLKIDAFGQTIDREFRNRIAPSPFAPVIETLNSDKQETYGVNVSAELRFADNIRTIVGAQYENDFLDVDASSRITPPGAPFPPPPTLRRDEARIKTTSIYAQNEITLSPQWALHFGGRYYNVEAELEQSNTAPLSKNTDDRFLASAGVVWTPNDTWALRGLFSQGYNYPTLNQLFTQTTAGGQLTLPNPDLKPETADNFELGARFDNGATIVDATLFYTDAKDYIIRQALPPAGGPPRAQYRNVEGAETVGFEIYAEHDLGNGLTPYASGAIINRELDYGNGFSTSDSGTPGLSGTIGLRKDFDFRGMPASFDVFATGESSAKLRDDAGLVTNRAGGWTTVNLRGSLDLTENASLTVQFNNILDKSYEPFGQIAGGERSVDVVLSSRF
ncbi:TonB-dependent receptor [Roseovarius spongiae]|uniref:TonB-dependent receptor n=1 Tax=Roseovarius spongiae TaxID=2320272 RepID=A0A3A8B916_9RHOB|nr:TonB-dependent receptor [Roseovarius spongiae]RKF14595.1 TonB-dependent receptor [Roseovarius spongiae]